MLIFVLCFVLTVTANRLETRYDGNNACSPANPFAAQAQLMSERAACLCGGQECKPPSPEFCSMMICQHRGEEEIKFSSKINAWVATCSQNQVHKSIFYCGSWGGRGCGRGLVKAQRASPTFRALGVIWELLILVSLGEWCECSHEAGKIGKVTKFQNYLSYLLFKSFKSFNIFKFMWSATFWNIDMRWTIWSIRNMNT